MQHIKSFVQEHCKSILDCGCGIALDYEHYKDNGIRYVGVDITPKFLEVAKKRGATTRQGSILDLPFKDKSFDAVYCKDVLMHLLFNDWKRALNEMVRVSRKYVLTLEPAWGADTLYSLREKYTAIESGKANVLMFFHNVYGIADVMAWAAQKGLTVQKWTYIDEEQGNALGLWQLTIYTKP